MSQEFEVGKMYAARFDGLFRPVRLTGILAENGKPLYVIQTASGKMGHVYELEKFSKTTGEPEKKKHSVVESINDFNVEADKFSVLSNALASENEGIVFYKNLQQMFPEWSQELSEIIEAKLNTVGKLESLRNGISKEISDGIEGGASGKDETVVVIAKPLE